MPFERSNMCRTSIFIFITQYSQTTTSISPLKNVFFLDNINFNDIIYLRRKYYTHYSSAIVKVFTISWWFFGGRNVELTRWCHVFLLIETKPIQTDVNLMYLLCLLPTLTDRCPLPPVHPGHHTTTCRHHLLPGLSHKGSVIGGTAAGLLACW